MSKRNTPEHKFEPIINPKSIKIAQDNQKSFTDRTMDMYISKHKRRDKDADEIEFEKSQNDCTFRPNAPSTRIKSPIPHYSSQQGQI